MCVHIIRYLFSPEATTNRDPDVKSAIAAVAAAANALPCGSTRPPMSMMMASLMPRPPSSDYFGGALCTSGGGSAEHVSLKGVHALIQLAASLGLSPHMVMSAQNAVSDSDSLQPATQSVPSAPPPSSACPTPLPADVQEAFSQIACYLGLSSSQVASVPAHPSSSGQAPANDSDVARFSAAKDAFLQLGQSLGLLDAAVISGNAMVVEPASDHQLQKRSLRSQPEFPDGPSLDELLLSSMDYLLPAVPPSSVLNQSQQPPSDFVNRSEPSYLQLLMSEGCNTTTPAANEASPLLLSLNARGLLVTAKEDHGHAPSSMDIHYSGLDDDDDDIVFDEDKSECDDHRGGDSIEQLTQTIDELVLKHKDLLQVSQIWFNSMSVNLIIPIINFL